MAFKFKERLLAGSGVSHKQFESDYAMKIMSKMGWQQGKGLGKQEHGMTSCLQYKRREDGLALGNSENEGFKWNDSWWENTFNSAIKNLQIPSTTDVRSKKNKSEEIKENIESEEESREPRKSAKKSKKAVRDVSSSTERVYEKTNFPVMLTKQIKKEKKIKKKD